MLDTSLAAVINAYLRADSEKSARLDEINHRTIRVHLRELEITRYVVIADRQVEFCPDGERDHYDVAIDISLAAARSLIAGTEPLELVKKDMISIDGDTHIVSVFQRVLREVEIDWEELLSGRIGDNLSHQIFQVLRSGSRFGRQLNQTVKESVREYMFEEASILPSQQEVDAFNRQVDQLRASADRFEARIERLEQRKHRAV